MTFPVYDIATETAGNGADAEQLHTEILAAAVQSATFGGVKIHDGEATVFFDPEPSAGDKAIIDSVVLAHDANSLDHAKRVKIAEIDAKTDDLISDGFFHDSKQFSLSLCAQAKMTGANLVRDESAFQYPVKWNTKDDKDTLEVTTPAEMNAFYLTGIGHIRNYLDSGTALKDQVRAATTIAEVDAVEDNR